MTRYSLRAWRDAAAPLGWEVHGAKWGDGAIAISVSRGQDPDTRKLKDYGYVTVTEDQDDETMVRAFETMLRMKGA